MDKLVERQSELVKTVEAIDGVLRNENWQVIRGVFEKLSERLERELLTEAKRDEIDVRRIYFIQGQLSTAKRYDLAHYAETLKKELQGLKSKQNVTSLES